jgi:voltage-gated potassium channel
MAMPTIRRTWVLPLLAASGALVVVTGGAVAAVETDTVTTLGRGLWWAVALMTTVGFVGDPPHTATGAALSVLLMVAGFFLLALVSAGLASLFVREDERDIDERAELQSVVLLAEIRALHARLDALQGGPTGGVEPAGTSGPAAG